MRGTAHDGCWCVYVFTTVASLYLEILTYSAILHLIIVVLFLGIVILYLTK